MEETSKTYRLSKCASEFNISLAKIIDFLSKKGIKVDNNPNAKITQEAYDILLKEFSSDKKVKETSKKLDIGSISRHESITLEKAKERSKEKEIDIEPEKELFIKNVQVATPVEPKATEKTSAPEKQKISTEEPKTTKTTKEKEQETKKTSTTKKSEVPKQEETTVETKQQATKEAEINTESDIVKTEIPKIPFGPKVVGKIDLPETKDKKTKAKEAKEKEKDKTKTQPETTEAADIKNKPADIQKEQPEPVVQKETTPSITDEKTQDSPQVTLPQEQEPTKDTTISTLPTAETIEEKTQPTVESEQKVEEKESNENFIGTEYIKLDGPKILGKIELPVEPTHKSPPKKQPIASSSDENIKGKKKRKRIFKEAVKPAEIKYDNKKGRIFDDTQERKEKHKKNKGKTIERVEVSEDEIQKQIRETLARLNPTGKSKAAKYRRQKRELIHQQIEEEQLKMEEEKKILKVTEFVTANELAQMMGVPVTEVISTCMSLGLFVSINQRLDAEVISIVAEEFGFKTEFITADLQETTHIEEDKPEDLVPRHPIVTVMGHVDHGKTLLLDYIRRSNVVAGEAGGITQHIGAYEVTLEDGKKITFLDTPGHEAFTAMRARGAKVTDIAIIVIAADDSVMPQTVEAINHAQAAKVPIIFAINKIDKPTANPDKIREALAKMNFLVEDWGGKYQCQEISAKTGANIDKLLEKVLLEAEFLELKANPNRKAYGTVLESLLEKGRGYVAKLLVMNGTLRVGDMVVAGCSYGRVKAMYNERNQQVTTAGPATPILMLGLNGAPQAGDQFQVFEDEREAKELANKRFQLQREQSLRTHKHITLDEIGRRIAIGDFKELNIIIKGDTDGSIEALSDSLMKLSTPEVQVNVIHMSVGQITESDVLLASASNAIIIGFQVRPSVAARRLAEQEQIDIRLYSIIYNAINELKSAIEGMLSPEIEEKIVCNLEVKETFKISKVGTVAGCICLDGKITRNTQVRIIRNGIVVYTGKLASLKRFKDDVKEVFAGQECGLSIENFNDIKVGDIIEGYEQTEIKRTLD